MRACVECGWPAVPGDAYCKPCGKEQSRLELMHGNGCDGKELEPSARYPGGGIVRGWRGARLTFYGEGENG